MIVASTLRMFLRALVGGATITALENAAPRHQLRSGRIVAVLQVGGLHHRYPRAG